MKPPWIVLCGLVLASACRAEVVFVDPVQEKAGAMPKPAKQPDESSRTGRVVDHTLDAARQRAGRASLTGPDMLEGPLPPASERAAEARDYQRGVKPAQETTIILQTVPAAPPSDAEKARAQARSWVAPAAPVSAQNRCRTENTVGGIEGQAGVRGTVVIQSTTSGVTVQCK